MLTANGELTFSSEPMTLIEIIRGVAVAAPAGG
jgi:hypothetical protein